MLNLRSKVNAVLGSEGHLRSRRRISDDKAFTLLELMVVMAMIVTLAAMSIPAMADAIESAYIAHAIGGTFGHCKPRSRAMRS